VMIALMFDAISDPLIGAISDRWRSRYGRRHPFLFASAIPLGGSFVALYSPPDGLTEWQLFAWLTVWTIVMRQALTLYHVPHLALGAELSDDYLERTRIMAYNAIFTVCGGAGIYVAAWSWFGANPDGTNNAASYAPFALVSGAFMTIVILCSAWFTRDRIPMMSTPRELPKFDLQQFKGEIGECLRNPNYRALLLGLVFLGIATGLRETLGSYMSLLFWELPETDIRWLGLAPPFGYVASFLVITRIHHTIGKRATMVSGLGLLILASCAPIVLRLIDWFPVNGDPWVWRWLMISSAVFYFGVSLLTISAMSSLADVADEHEITTGHRQEGILFAARTFFGKVTQSLGVGLAGLMFGLIGFESGSRPGEVDADVLRSLGIIDGPVAAIPVIIAMIFYGMYKIDRSRLQEIQTALAERRKALRP